MKKYKAVLFDFDGTIMDTNKYIINSWQHMAAKVMGDRRFDEEYLIKYFGTPLYDSMVIAQKDYGIEGYTPEELCDFYREYQREHRDLMGEIFPGVGELIKELKNRGILIGIVTSRGNQDTRNGLSRFGLDIFDAYVGMDDTSIHKPLPEPCLICLEKLGVKAEDAIMLGDSRFDIECANNAGADSAFVSWSFCTKAEDLTGNAKPDYIINRAEQVLELV